MSQHHHHDHGHAEEDPYYLDQMCLVALSAVFGAVCLSLYFWRTDILMAMLAPQFFPLVLGSGIALLILAVLRGAALWIQMGKATAHEHHHDHEHAPAAPLTSLPLLGEAPAVQKSLSTLPMTEGCGTPGHEGCGHDHSHDHAHDHDHAHSHGHDHAHGHGDHDHGWAPWRYVLLLVPVILFFLGIPVKPPPLNATETKDADPWEIVYNFKDLFPGESSHGTELANVHHLQGPMLTTSWIGVGDMPLTQAAVLLAGAPKRGQGPGEVISFPTLESSALTPELRAYWAGKRVTVNGQFANDPTTDRRFSLARQRINCCYADATVLKVTILCSQGVTHVKRDEWVDVTGEIQYRKDETGYQTVLKVGSKDDVKKTEAATNPYIN